MKSTLRPGGGFAQDLSQRLASHLLIALIGWLTGKGHSMHALADKPFDAFRRVLATYVVFAQDGGFTALVPRPHNAAILMLTAHHSCDMRENVAS